MVTKLNETPFSLSVLMASVAHGAQGSFTFLKKDMLYFVRVIQKLDAFERHTQIVHYQLFILNFA
jgi:hypothetical protein